MMLYVSNTKGSIPTLLAFCCLFVSSLGLAESSAYSHEDLNRKIGQAIFEKLWVFAPSSTKSSDGLGPLYNARSCHQCHDSTKSNNTSLPNSLVIQLSIEEPVESKHPNIQHSDHELKTLGYVPEPVYGKQLQTFAYPGAKAEADISVSYQNHSITFPDGETVSLAKPTYHFSNLAYGELDKNVRFSPRVAPRMFGLSLIESISEKNIISGADPLDKNNDGISGKINRVWNDISQTSSIGRFGWKAGKASLEQQNLVALSTDIGVSSWLFPLAQGDCTLAQKHCTELALKTETHLITSSRQSSLFEAPKEMTDLLVLFTRTMGERKPKAHANNSTASVSPGKQLFNQLGCQHCHNSYFDGTLSADTNDKSSTAILPYSDLLLHDMGEGLADHRNEFDATGKEWRTAPLWGIAEYLQQTPKPMFLHDGRAKSVIEAILWHGGESEKSKQAFMTLSKQQRTTLINFVESL